MLTLYGREEYLKKSLIPIKKTCAIKHNIPFYRMHIF